MMDGSLGEDGKTPMDYDYNASVTRQVVDAPTPAASLLRVRLVASGRWKPVKRVRKTVSVRR